MKIIRFLVGVLHRLPDSAKRSLRAALFAFLSTFSLSLVGFLNDVQSWMATGGHFPSVAVLAKALFSALAAGGTLIIAYLINKLEDRGWLPTLLGVTKPEDPPPAH